MEDEDLLSRMTVREATHDDYQAVMNMASPDTFRDGFDYLPAKFHGFVDDPDTVFLLVEVDGEVVFIDVECLQESGKTIYGKTIRVAKRLQGRGFYKAFVDATNIMYFCWDATPMKDRLTDAQMSLPALVPYRPTETHRLLPPAFSAAVLSEGTVFVDWVPYKLSESNMKKLVEASCYILVDSNVPTAKSLSFGGSYMTPRGRVYHIDIHCKDEALCKAHITNHVKNACSQYTGMITFCVMVIDKGLKDVVMEFCVQYLHFRHLPHDHAYFHAYLDLETYWNSKMTKPVSKSKY
ncbi:probable N-acetyltransferase 16 [Branchiostoma floridae]|uniref:Probable N-acetyltransferase 16 n=1 Tax=Branchiostoma floridae TaxID=7739 RepID=A0A9J7LMD9_BRAFL|nr:probable N-acetyltransferase 16 [Branchiostoma floridae]